MKKLRLILAELGTPGAQRDSWFAWAAGQMAHAMIGAVLAGGLLFVLLPLPAWYLVTVGYAALKEVPDLARAPSWANARDCTQDALFVTAGAALAVAIAGAHDRLFFVSLIAAAIGLWLGVSDRLKGADNAGG
jgi:hypothetical protein